jgi:hypothetical protein
MVMLLPKATTRRANGTHKIYAVAYQQLTCFCSKSDNHKQSLSTCSINAISAQPRNLLSTAIVMFSANAEIETFQFLAATLVCNAIYT